MRSPIFANGWKEKKIEGGIEVVSTSKKLIAVIGATGQRGAQRSVPCRPAANLGYAL